MKGLLSTLFVLSVVASGVANAQPRAASNGLQTAGQVSARQPLDESNRGQELYYGYTEDVSNALYWSTPKELGGGAELGPKSGARRR